VVVTMLAGLFGLAVPAPALAAEVRTGEAVQVSGDETINDDVYLFGNNVVVQGTVNGDVIAAGSTVTVTGHVTGDVMTAGNTVLVSGPVDGSVRAAGSTLTVFGPVRDDLLAAGSNITLNTPGAVARDVLAAGAVINLQAPVGGDVKASGGTLTIDSTVGGSVTAEVSDLVLGSGAQVAGPVAYVSANDARVASAARTTGAVQRTPPATAPASPLSSSAFDVLAFARGFVGLAALGAILVLIFPSAAGAAAGTVERRWLASLGLGFALVAGVPLLALMVFGVGLVVGGWWIGLMLLALYSMLLVVGYLASAEGLGVFIAHLAGRRVHPAWSLLIGLLPIGLLTAIPWVGGFVGLMAVLLGVGALALSGWAAYRRPIAAAPTIVEPQPTVPLAAAA
jgi:cytoskeletal protein CcmA (bactofilin family)